MRKLQKAQTKNLTGTLTVPRLHFEGTFAYTLLNNFIYFDKTFKPQQGNAPLSILQLILSENLKFRSFHLDNTVVVQKPTEKYVRLPEFYMKNSLYTEGKIFKKTCWRRLVLIFDTIRLGWHQRICLHLGSFLCKRKGK